jgi:hypothetical protein
VLGNNICQWSLIESGLFVDRQNDKTSAKLLCHPLRLRKEFSYLVTIRLANRKLEFTVNGTTLPAVDIHINNPNALHIFVTTRNCNPTAIDK